MELQKQKELNRISVTAAQRRDDVRQLMAEGNDKINAIFLQLIFLRCTPI